MNVRKEDIENYTDVQRKSALSCHDIANVFFNQKEYEDAVKWYLEGISHIESIYQKNDEDYRNLTMLFIDLSDTFFHLCQQQAAATAFENAVLAFKKIQNKTSAEYEIASKNDNYVSFRNHFEKNLSTDHYLTSAAFYNHEHMLTEKHKENELYESMSHLAVSESNNSFVLDNLFNAFTLNDASFRCLPSKALTSDEEYRKTSEEFIRLASEQFSKNNIKHAINTLKQASTAIKFIKEMTPSDTMTLKALDDQIALLRQQNTQERVPPTSVSTHSMFTHRMNVERNVEEEDKMELSL